MIRRVETFAAGALIAVLVVGVALTVVTRPWLTALLVDHVDSSRLTGLSASQTLELAEEVRLYVTRPDAPPLPGSAFGRSAFDAEQVSHLDDVRDVILAARTVTGITLLATVMWVAWCLFQSRRFAVAAALKVAGALLVGSPMLVFAVGLLDFDMLFARFHAVFFAAGTWTFSAGDLVIQLFPEAFWVWAAATWGALAMATGVVLLAASRLPSLHESGVSRAGRVAEGA